MGLDKELGLEYSRYRDISYRNTDVGRHCAYLGNKNGQIHSLVT